MGRITKAEAVRRLKPPSRSTIYRILKEAVEDGLLVKKGDLHLPTQKLRRLMAEIPIEEGDPCGICKDLKRCMVNRMDYFNCRNRGWEYFR